MQDLNGGSASEAETAFFSVAEASLHGGGDDDAPPLPEPHPPQHRPAAWHQDVSASFAQLARQFAAASHAGCLVPPAPDDQPPPALLERLQSIEDGQRRLGREIAALREQVAAFADADAERTRAPPVTATATLADLEADLKEQRELFILDQERLPVRLQNSHAVKSLSPVRMLPMRNRKLPVNGPSTRGEFEHLTKERYEALMKSYDIPISGDIVAKRDTLRAFLGIPPDPPQRK